MERDIFRASRIAGLVRGRSARPRRSAFILAKNLGACGEAGAVTTNDQALAARVCLLRDHGQARKYYHDIEGYNGRLDAIQAGILSVKLQHLNEWNEERRARATEYRSLFEAEGNLVKVPHEPTWSHAVHHLYVVRTDDREGLMAFLNYQGIGSGVHYPIPLHLQKAYQHLGYREGDFPICERAAREIVSLPMFPQLRPDQQQRVVRTVAEFLASKSHRPPVEPEAEASHLRRGEEVQSGLLSPDRHFI